jgi:hypothetical protein
MKTFLTLALTIMMAALSAYPAAAQEGRPAPVAEFAAGTFLFPDDSPVREGFAGGAVRFHLSPRLSVGPEVAYVQGRNHSHLMLSGNVTFDFIGPVSGREPAVTPFVTAGGGVFSSRGPAPFSGTTTYNEGAFTAGGGVRARVGERMYVGGEVRFGWELHLRVNALVGVRLGK